MQDMDVPRPTLWILDNFPRLFLAEFAILETSSVATYTFHHKTLIILCETMRPHGGVGHPPGDKCAPKDGQNAICHEKSPPGAHPRFVRDERETERQKPTKDLVQTIHHEPVYQYQHDDK